MSAFVVCLTFAAVAVAGLGWCVCVASSRSEPWWENAENELNELPTSADTDGAVPSREPDVL